MIDPNLEDLCDRVRKMQNTTPVDPIGIAQSENIVLAPGDYGDGFDGRIEYLTPEKRFVIYYQDTYANVPEVRMRFSVAHELGHFYLPSHRENLFTGENHNSEQGMMSDKQREREADAFAASLLIPRRELSRRMGGKNFLSMDELVAMADDLKVSILASVIRYSGYAEEMCSIVLSKEGIVMGHLPSDEMKNIGLSFLKYGSIIPGDSAAQELVATGAYRKISGLETTVEKWYGRKVRHGATLYEDSFSLGYGGRVITLLTFQ